MAVRCATREVELLEARHVKAALSAMPVKTDRNDARGLAQLMRLGWFRPVHCKSMATQEVRALLTARKLVQSKLYDETKASQEGGIEVLPEIRGEDGEPGERLDALQLGSVLR